MGCVLGGGWQMLMYLDGPQDLRQEKGHQQMKSESDAARTEGVFPPLSL